MCIIHAFVVTYADECSYLWECDSYLCAVGKAHAKSPSLLLFLVEIGELETLDERKGKNENQTKPAFLIALILHFFQSHSAQRAMAPYTQTTILLTWATDTCSLMRMNRVDIVPKVFSWARWLFRWSPNVTWPSLNWN